MLTHIVSHEKVTFPEASCRWVMESSHDGSILVVAATMPDGSDELLDVDELFKVGVLKHKDIGQVMLKQQGKLLDLEDELCKHKLARVCIP